MGVGNFAPIVHIVAAVFAIIELGLTAYYASLWHGTWSRYGYNWGGPGSSSPPVVNFMVFNSVWSLLVLAYVGLTPLYMTSVFHRLAALALNVITAIFWFAGSIALAVGFGGPYSCGANTTCGSVEAAIAFGFFLWALFTFLAVVDGIESLRRRGHRVDTTKNTNAYPGA
ncbi:membrane-associating domain-containing protein [Xylariaceae sp. FL0594]|nr:membrane-associating domain-containing protein [Xylariaceae sp. FL0594]